MHDHQLKYSQRERLSPEGKAFLSGDVLKNFIGGLWRESTAARIVDVVDPSCGETLARLPLSTEQDVDAAIIAATQAFPAWSGLPSNERSSILLRLAKELKSRLPQFAELEALDVGKAIVNAESFDIPFGIDCLHYYADLNASATHHAKLDIPNMKARVRRVPYGVCAFILPWNFPFDLLMWGIVPALAAGNTVVVKPSEVTPLTTLYLCEAALHAGLPPGVLNVVLGDGTGTGAALATHKGVRRMSFTGSTSAGKAIAHACAENLIPCKLELGGKGAAVVSNDVDIVEVTRALTSALTLNSGQVCCTATRWLIHENIFDDFVSAAKEHLTNVRIGPSLSRDTEMGPLASGQHLKRVSDYMTRGVHEGATQLLVGGDSSRSPHDGGFYFSPSLLTGDPDNVCWKEEIFGPVAYVVKFGSDEEAISLVNESKYGLANSVWSKDNEWANAMAEQLVAGNSWINAHNVFAYGLPYGGINQSGMGGGVNGAETYYDYLRNQTIAQPY
jgi:acyl-CoA reductase-like NAD-dependent aldehyde dehydrogenase